MLSRYHRMTALGGNMPIATFPRTARRLTAAVIALCAAMATLVAPGTAAAVGAQALACGGRQHEYIVQPQGDLDIWVTVCVRSDGNIREAAVNDISIHTQPLPGRQLFYYFRVQVRLERYDADHKVNKCDYTAQANDPGWWGLYTCRSGTVSTSLRGGWTGDGYVEYDKVGDGHGRQVWELTGSPAIN